MPRFVPRILIKDLASEEDAARGRKKKIAGNRPLKTQFEQERKGWRGRKETGFFPGCTGWDPRRSSGSPWMDEAIRLLFPSTSRSGRVESRGNLNSMRPRIKVFSADPPNVKARRDVYLAKDLRLKKRIGILSLGFARNLSNSGSFFLPETYRKSLVPKRKAPFRETDRIL